MNSNAIHAGEFYAWAPYRSKGHFPVGAIKVVVGRVRKQKYTYEKNRRTEVEVTLLEEKGRYKEGQTFFVPAREIVDYWDSYKDEEAVLLAERERRDYEQRKVQMRRKVLEQLVQTRLAGKGFPATASVSGRWVTFELAEVVVILGITDDELDRTVTEALGPRSEDSSTGYTTGPTTRG